MLQPKKNLNRIGKILKNKFVFKRFDILPETNLVHVIRCVRDTL